MSGPAKASPGGMSGPVRTCLDLPGPVWTSPGGQVLTANQQKYFSFLQELHLSFFKRTFLFFNQLQANFNQIHVFLNKSMYFQSRTCPGVQDVSSGCPGRHVLLEWVFFLFLCEFMPDFATQFLEMIVGHNLCIYRGFVQSYMSF